VSLVDDETQDDPVAPQEPEEDDGRGKSLESLLWRQARGRVKEAYRCYADDPERYADGLFGAVIDFATRKLYPLEYEFKDHGTTETVDDFAQEVAIEVWSTIDAKKFSSPAKFYSWLNRLCFTKSKDAGKGLRRAVMEKVPLFTPVPGDESGDADENPLLNRFSQTVDRGFPIPEWVVGTDLAICLLIQDGITDYARIGYELGLKTQTVTNRVSLLRKRAKAVKDTTPETKKIILAEPVGSALSEQLIST
jgi:hypothetical protein